MATVRGQPGLWFQQPDNRRGQGAEDPFTPQAASPLIEATDARHWLSHRVVASGDDQIVVVPFRQLIDARKAVLIPS